MPDGLKPEENDGDGDEGRADDCSDERSLPALDPGRMGLITTCLLYTSPSPRDQRGSRMPSSA